MHKFLPIFVVIIFALAAFFYLPLKKDLAYTFGLTADKIGSCCSVEELLTNKGEFDENANTAIFNNQVIDYPKTSLAQGFYSDIKNGEESVVLGTTAGNGQEKWIEVSLEEQKLRAWEGSSVLMEYPISSGLRWYPTPKGTFYIWYKTRSQVMKGGSRELGNYYYLPNVPNNMFFHKGYAIHGAYWHNNFGNPMSHGCVNEPLAQAAAIFDWAGPVIPSGQNVVKASPENPGTRVFIH